MNTVDHPTLHYAAAKAANVLSDIEAALGPDDAYLAHLIVLFMLAAICEEKRTPSFQAVEQLRVVRRLARIERE
jgi:hypothetical protein